MLERAWRHDKKLQPIHHELLGMMLRESVKIVENMELDTKYQKAEITLMIKDAQINKLQEQIVYRDELIDEARRVLKSAGLDEGRIRDERILGVEEIIYDHKTIFDPANAASHRGSDSQLRNQPHAAHPSPKREAYGSNPSYGRRPAQGGYQGMGGYAASSG